MAANPNDAAGAPRNTQNQQRLPAVNNLVPLRNARSGSDEPERNLSRCCICLEDMPTDEGLTCPHGHFICDGCLGDYFEARVNVENIRTHLLRLPCPVPDCQSDSFASLRVIAAHLPPVAVGLILDNMYEVLEFFINQLQAQPEPVRPVPELPPQDDIEVRREYIVENILTLKRPCCGFAFFDFTGCLAIKCPNCDQNRNAFCAMCLAPCGNDAHQHVRTQHGNLFITDVEWRAHHNRRRQAQLLDYLRLPGDWNRGDLLEALRVDLVDLGMNFEEIRIRALRPNDPNEDPIDAGLVEALLQTIDQGHRREVELLERMADLEDDIHEREDDVHERENDLREREARLLLNEQQHQVVVQQVGQREENHRQRENNLRQREEHLLRNEQQHQVVVQRVGQRENILDEREDNLRLRNEQHLQKERDIITRETNAVRKEGSIARREAQIHVDQRKLEGRWKVTSKVWIVLVLIVIGMSTALGVVVSRMGGATSVSSIDSNITATASTSTPTSTSIFATVTTTTASPIPSLTQFGPLDRNTLMELPSPLPQPTNTFRDWGTEQALGIPNTFTYDDAVTAWKPQTEDSSYEWLLLDYNVPVYPVSVNVYETHNPGAVVEIWVFPPGSNDTSVNGAELFWSGPPQTNLTDEAIVFAFLTNNSAIQNDAQFATSRILLIVNNSVPGWHEIDAVGLVDSSIGVQWALSAAASSCYAGGDYFSHSSGGGGMVWWKILLIVVAVLVFLSCICCICGCQ
ncbi:hypothetical protein BC937DRAFT_90138 [Endogone sp. FLAS-F59071]|nr:hypothetical protein BC937DRAFT_90138 [Endogone sp. FLAS-F59071]|eukprot:RUS17317.1 hypothetical protein BC937DRAFT_90138 [Endogone sp. FLAS-F59071]